MFDIHFEIFILIKSVLKLKEYENHQYNHHRAVCGTDGKTYKTECQLRKRACRQESTSLTIAYKGQCQSTYTI